MFAPIFLTITAEFVNLKQLLDGLHSFCEAFWLLSCLFVITLESFSSSNNVSESGFRWNASLSLILLSAMCIEARFVCSEREWEQKQCWAAIRFLSWASNGMLFMQRDCPEFRICNYDDLWFLLLTMKGEPLKLTWFWKLFSSQNSGSSRPGSVHRGFQASVSNVCEAGGCALCPAPLKFWETFFLSSMYFVFLFVQKVFASSSFACPFSDQYIQCWGHCRY